MLHSMGLFKVLLQNIPLSKFKRHFLTVVYVCLRFNADVRLLQVCRRIDGVFFLVERNARQSCDM